MAPWLVVFPLLLAGAGEDARPAPETELLGKIQQYMGTNLERLPGHACLATIDRSIRSKKKVLVQDRVRLEVAFTGFDETFSWPGAAQFETGAALKVAPGGAGSIGGWSGWTRRIFRSSTTGFTHGGSCTVQGRPGIRYDFQVPWNASAYTVNLGGKNIVLPYAGTVCVVPGSLDAMRLEVRGEVGKLPIAGVTETLDYAPVEIGGERFLLPRSHEVVMIDQDGNEGRNVTKLSDCRRHAAGSPENAGGQALPPNIDMELKLETPITFEQAAVGDAVTARLSRGMKAGGVSFPKGAQVTGRIRRLEQRLQPEKHYIVGLEFRTITSGGVATSFRARLTGPGLRYERRPDSVDQRTLYNPPPPLIDVKGLEIDDSEPASGVGVFRIRGAKLRLSPGMRMEWETLEQ